MRVYYGLWESIRFCYVSERKASIMWTIRTKNDEQKLVQNIYSIIIRCIEKLAKIVVWRWRNIKSFSC